MQIRSDYHSHSGMNYRNSHTHHMTKCLHEDESKQQKLPESGAKNNAFQEKEKGTFTRDEGYSYGENSPGAMESAEGKAAGAPLGKTGFFKKMWEALGEEGQPGENARTAAGANIAISSIRQLLPAYFVNKWESVREKIKVGVGAALKRFKKENDTFAALTDPREHSAGKKGREGRLPRKEEKVLRRGNVEIISEVPMDGHLMDSYSKTGEYCKLNENLTFRKKV